MIKHLIAVLLIILGLILVSLNVSVTRAAAAGSAGVVTLNLNPSSGQTAIKVVVSGTNAPNAPLSLWIAPESDPTNMFQLMAAIQPAVDGSWDAQVYIPREWPRHTVVPGKYLFTAQNADKSYVAQGEFTVLPAATAKPSPATQGGVAEGVVSWLNAKNPLLPIVLLIAILGGVAILVNKYGKPSA